MGGLGKITLARQVFNDEMVKRHFEGLAWVCISQQFTRKYVWQTIFRNLQPNHEEMAEDGLQNKLFELLETQKSLIVFDDIWKEEDWDRIKAVFPPTRGWKILLTSRNEGVPFRVDPTCLHFKLEFLTLEESWILFRRIAFLRNNTTESNIGKMEDMGKQMIEHCGGLPLAIKVLGGMLAARYTLCEWKRVYQNIGSQIVERFNVIDKDSSSVYHILCLSFEELPIYLKHCFLYLSHFPEDYAIDVEKLSNYWAAEEIPKPRHYNGATVRDIADGYIEELVKRNIVIAERDIVTSRFETCHLHDMMREVCLRKAEEENFFQVVDGLTYTSTASSQSPRQSRRLVIHRPSETIHLKNPKLRSLVFILEYATECWMASSLCFKRLQLMRVLDLSGAHFAGGKVPSHIGKLFHLRYLSLHNARVRHLPSSMGNLKLLIYLNIHVDAGSPVYVPNFLNGMQELRYLSLPDRINDTTKLELGNLVNLETLAYFSTKHSSVRDLQRLKRLETLSILFIGGCTRETLSLSISMLPHLKNLSMYDHMGDEEGFVLDCINLNKLELKVYMPRLPGEQNLPSRLTTIHLQNCHLEEDSMPILEKLLHLTEVTLGDRSFYGRIMVCSAGGFPKLRNLGLFGLDDLEEWIAEEGSMPLLRTLSIGYCKKLKELPRGLKYLTSLKKLTIERMKREWNEKLEKGGDDYYKVQHIPLLQFFLVR